jgi:hypothetical protein
MFSVCSRKKYDKAISACNGALKISPDFQLAKKQSGLGRVWKVH